MTAINFPDSPSNGDTHTSGNTSYTYQSAKARWVAVSSSGSGSADGVTSNFTANGAITAYNPVVINSDGTISSVALVSSGSSSTAANHGHQDALAFNGSGGSLNYDTENDQWVFLGGYQNDTHIGRFDSNGDFEWDVGPLNIGGGNWGDMDGELVYDSTLDTYIVGTADLTEDRMELHQATITTSGYTVNSTGWVNAGSIDDANAMIRVKGPYLVGTSKVALGYYTTSNKYPAIKTALATSGGGFTIQNELVLATRNNTTSAVEFTPFDMSYHSASGKIIAVYQANTTEWKYSVIDTSGSTPSEDSNGVIKTLSTALGSSNNNAPLCKFTISGDRAMAVFILRNPSDGFKTINVIAGAIDSSTGEVTWGSETNLVSSQSFTYSPALGITATKNGNFAVMYTGYTAALDGNYYLNEFSVDSSGDATSVNSVTVSQDAAKAVENSNGFMEFDPDTNKLLIGLGTAQASYGLSGWHVNTFTHTAQFSAPSSTNVARYIGFAAAGISDLASGAVTLSGVQTGFTGLSASIEYYLSDTGALSASDTGNAKVGIAVSSTKILLR